MGGFVEVLTSPIRYAFTGIFQKHQQPPIAYLVKEFSPDFLFKTLATSPFQNPHYLPTPALACISLAQARCNWSKKFESDALRRKNSKSFQRSCWRSWSRAWGVARSMVRWTKKVKHVNKITKENRSALGKQLALNIDREFLLGNDWVSRRASESWSENEIESSLCFIN